jgi:hypothetical protein
VDEVFLRLVELAADNCRPYPLGLSRSQVQVIMTVEHALEQTREPGEDFSRSAKWRGETVSALASTASFRDNQESKLKDASHGLRAVMAHWIPSEALVTQHMPAL